MSEALPARAADLSKYGSRGEPFWPNGWWRFVDARIGVIPMPVYLLLLVACSSCPSPRSPPASAARSR